MRRISLFMLGAAICLGACSDHRASAAPPSRPASHVDTIVPRAEALRRFQATAHPADTLAGGERSRDALVRGFVRALETRDTVRLSGLALDRDEFAYLYYPTAPQGLPPYELSPDLFWFTLEQGSAKGLRRALDTRSGRPLGYVGYRCDSMPSHEGRNVVWGPCAVRYRRGNRTEEERLFGLIIEREGRFKFVSYANKL
jgi:hypothetical protein